MENFSLNIDMSNHDIDKVIKALKVAGIECVSVQSKFSDDETMLTPQDVQDYLGIGTTTVYDLFKNKDFPSVRIHNRHVVMKSDFMKYIASYKGKKTKSIR